MLAGVEVRSPGPMPEDPGGGQDRLLPGHPLYDPAAGGGPAPGYGAAPDYGGDPGYGTPPSYAPPRYGPVPGYPADPSSRPRFDDSPTTGYVPVDGYGQPTRTTEPPVFDLQFAVEADDAYDANVSVQQFTRWFIVVAVLMAVGFLALAALRGTLDLWTVGAAVLLVVGALLLAPASRWFVRYQNRSLEGLDASATLNRLGLHFEGPLGRQDVPWASLTDVTESGRVIVFRYDTLPVAYLPKSSFASTQQQKSAVAFARKCIDLQAAEAPELQR